MDESSQARGAIGISIFVLLGCTLIGVFLVKPDPVQQGNINLIIGGLLTALGLCTQFYFGSSAGSKALAAAQTETVQKLTDAVATSAPVVVSPPDKRLETPPPAAAPDPALKVATIPDLTLGLREFLIKAHELETPLTEEQLVKIWNAFQAGKVA